ncbi:MAG: DMT family transporter [Candidatus Bathyarchaeaceae archaeon]
MKIKIFLMLSIVIFLWGSSFALLKLGLEEISPINLAFLRFLIALPFFVVFTYFQDKHVFDKSIFRDWKILLTLGLTGVTLYHVFQNFGLRLTTASNSSLLISSNPIFIALLDHFYLKEKMTWKRVFGIILAFLGIILIIRPSKSTFDPMGVAGDLLSLGAGLSWALYSVFGKKVLASYGAQRVTMFSMIFGTLLLFPILLVSEKPALPTSLWLWFLLLILSLPCSGMAYLFWYKALEDVSPTKAGVFLFFLPVVSVSVAHLVLLESLDISFAIGALFVMLGVIITQRS